MSPPRANTPALPPIIVIGPGRVGRSIERAATLAGLDVALAGRSDLVELAPGREIALLCVPDSEIPAASSALAAASPGLRFAGHTSGATGLAAIDACRRAGASTFSLHPLQTFPDGEAELAGCPAAVAGSGESALALAHELADRLGLEPFEVPEDSRGAYHAAAAIASNFLVALESSAVELLAAAGIADSIEARRLLSPLVLRTAANWTEHGSASLTGPVARGDEETVARHREAIAATAPELEPLYDVLVDRTRSIAANREVVRA